MSNPLIGRGKIELFALACLLLFGSGLTLGQEAITPLADLTCAPGIDRFASIVRYVYHEPCSDHRREGRTACKATFRIAW